MAEHRDGARGAGGDGRARQSTRATWRCWPSAAPARCTPPRSPTSSGMSRVVVPRASGVLSALGLVLSERRRDLVESVLLAGDELTRRGRGRRGRAAGRAGPRRARRSRAPSCAPPTTCATRARRSSCPSDGELEPDPSRAARGVRRAHERALRLRRPGRRARARDRARGRRPAGRGAAGAGGGRAAPRAAARRALFDGDWRDDRGARPRRGVDVDGPGDRRAARAPRSWCRRAGGPNPGAGGGGDGARAAWTPSRSR